MKIIILKTSTYKRVQSRLRSYGLYVDFNRFVCLVSHDSTGTYLYFANFCDLCCASNYLAKCNAVYRVIEISTSDEFDKQH